MNWSPMSMKAIAPPRPRSSKSKKRPYQSSASSTSSTSSAMWLMPTSRAIRNAPSAPSVRRGNLEHRARLRGTNDSPGRHVSPNLDHPLLAVEEDKVQPEAHPEGMNAPAAAKQQPGAGAIAGDQRE